MTTNVPSIDDAADQLHLGYSVFIGVCVAASLFFIPSFLGGHALPSGGPVGVMQTIAAFTLGITASCHVCCHLDIAEFER